MEEITSKYDCNFYYLNCFHSRRRDKKLKSHKKRKTTSEKDNMLKFNQYMKSDKMPSTTYVTIESLIKKIDGCANNLEKSSTTKIGEHISCGYSMSAIWAFDRIESKHTIHHGEDCMKNFCSFLREHATNILNFEKRKLLTLTKEELKLHQDATNYQICGKRILKKFVKSKSYQKVRHHCYYTGKYRSEVHSICNLRFNIHCVKFVQIRSFFWPVFSRIRTEYGEILRISPYSVQMRENTDQKNSVFRHFSRSDTQQNSCSFSQQVKL